MRFNANDRVRVRLTDEGRKAHRAWHDRLYASAHPQQREQWYKPPKEDADGRSEWQLWCLMQEVGWACSNSMRPPFDPEIEIVEG